MNNKDILMIIRWYAFHEAEKEIETKFNEGGLSLNEFYYLAISAFANYSNNGVKPKWHQWKRKHRDKRINEGFEFLINTLNNKVYASSSR